MHQGGKESLKLLFRFDGDRRLVTSSAANPGAVSQQPLADRSIPPAYPLGPAQLLLWTRPLDATHRL